MEIRTKQISKREINLEFLNEKYNNYTDYDTVAVEITFIKDNDVTRKVLVFSEDVNVI